MVRSLRVMRSTCARMYIYFYTFYIYLFVDVKNGMDSPWVRKKVEEDEIKSKRTGYDEVHNALTKSVEEDNSRFIRDQKQVTQSSIKQQDESIEQLGQAVERLGQVGREINTEIKEQNIMLDELGNEIDDSHSRMNAVQASLGKLLKTKDGCQIWTIVILTAILLLLGNTPHNHAALYYIFSICINCILRPSRFYFE